MTTVADARVQFTESEVVTLSVRGTARRWLFWILVALLLVLLGFGALLAAGAATSQDALSAANPAGNGAEALVNVLRTDHVTVFAPDTLVHAGNDASHSTNTTVAVYDPTSILTRSQLEELRTIATNLILIQPSTHELDVLAPSVSQAGYVSPLEKSDCDYLPVQRAGEVNGLQNGYRIAAGSSDAVGCLGGGGVYSLVRVHHDGQTITVLGSDNILQNQYILQDGNGALALGLFGSTKDLVWYLPTLADVKGTVAGSPLPAPEWVGLSITLVAVVFVAAAFWRGRRLGPVVVERMPVNVRSNETMEGRARLYQKASARQHALDSLRIGTVSRIATLCGLPKLASVEEVIGAASRVTGREPGDIRGILLDTVPHSDLQLVHLSDRLLELEADVRRGVLPA